MNIKVSAPQGLYVLAVSGGVDSVVLLDLLASQQDAKFVVAHFDHGIRSDSKKDRLLVQKLTEEYGLPFEYREAKLSPNSSEETARQARYEFLNEVKNKYGAKGVITAHHQDDLIETAIINMIRGTGRRGISSLNSSDELVRPLLDVPKAKIREYAIDRGLSWNEDSTNDDTSYLRNYVRLQLLPKFSNDDKKRLLGIINQTGQFNQEVDKELSDQLSMHLDDEGLDRNWFIMLPHSVAKEIMATWLRREGLAAFDRKTIERAVIASKTFRANTQVDIYNNYLIIVKKKHLALATIDR
jgi:tRNA(Ile)-lysidine synthase